VSQRLKLAFKLVVERIPGYVSFSIGLHWTQRNLKQISVFAYNWYRRPTNKRTQINHWAMSTLQRGSRVLFVYVCWRVF